MCGKETLFDYFFFSILIEIMFYRELTKIEQSDFRDMLFCNEPHITDMNVSNCFETVIRGAVTTEKHSASYINGSLKKTTQLRSVAKFVLSMLL